ncbi:ribonuclease III [Entomobacter blattae]|uniref:ribonuclease III n=1 Tax=Entomobacter blattae TaxID=2762277 RepID=UPI00193B18E8|nr:ribonuclease III [Entomobacter blattae]
MAPHSGDKHSGDKIEKRIGYSFASKPLLVEALTHRSALHVAQGGGRRSGRGGHKKSRPQKPKGRRSNERLEFIGDRVLGLLMAEKLLEQFPDEQEGDLGARHAYLVSRVVLARLARIIRLHEAILVAEHEEAAGVRNVENVQADAMEALLGAIYLDGGLSPVREVFRKLWDDVIGEHINPPKDPKTALQEWLLGRGKALPVYKLDHEEGPSHAPKFVISVAVDGLTGIGEASNKREAERLAAGHLLAQLVMVEGH